MQPRGAEGSRIAPVWGQAWQLLFALWTWSCASSWREVLSHRKAALSSCWDTWIWNAMSSMARELQTHARWERCAEATDAAPAPEPGPSVGSPVVTHCHPAVTCPHPSTPPRKTNPAPPHTPTDPALQDGPFHKNLRLGVVCPDPSSI